MLRLFENAYILGGSPCSGKSTIAERLAAQFDLPLYKVDDHEQEHARRCQPERQPTMHRFTQRSWDEIWSRPAALQVEEELDYFRERFDLILEDLQAYDLGKPLLLEGAAFLPELISRAEVRRDRVLYMVPTLTFQLHHYQQRPWIRGILDQCTDPDQAFANWMLRDHLFGQEVLRQARDYQLAAVIVDGSLSVDEQFKEVVSWLHLG